MKQCYGDVKVNFYETNNPNISLNSMAPKTIKDNNTFLHYLKMTKRNIFIELKNESSTNDAYFDLMPYLEKSVSKDPSSEIAQLDDGKVLFETDSKRIMFKGLQI